ncbi:Gfo/Idh/MocA family protein [Planctomicrobium sp. SH668]|uniref:Gfo/Idh/MocA family protein n=1 Tax=Planctomicrobium sp. SH668 TaxID=3448126 RepID=UPI003F5B0153
MKQFKTSRRQFLQGSIAAGAGIFAAPAMLKAQSANQKLNVAFIGVGGRGGGNLGEIAANPNVHVVALCDVNKQNLKGAAANYPHARTYVDFRELYTKLDDIDAVVVSTSEHTHAFATMPALKAGKHVYCEKPLTHNVYESRAIQKAAEKANVATQMGTQIHGFPNYRRVVELIQSGAIGPVREAHVWVSRAWGLQSEDDAKAGGDIVFAQDRPTEVMTPPEFLDWDLWLGPAPERPYHDVYFPGPKWYRWWDFGSGTMSDLGSHWNDLPFWALNLDAPKTIEAFGPPAHPELAPATMSAKYEYGPRGDMPACTLTWYQGHMKPQIWIDNKIPQWGSGVLFIGDDGMLLADYGNHVLLPEEKFANFKRPEPFIPDSPGQHAEWINACLNGTPTGSPFSYAGPLTEANHLGNVAYRVGKKIVWDAEKMVAVDCPEADMFLKRTPRAGWSL